MDIAGKVAVVTGAGAGIGAAIARGVARSGARVVVADLDGAGARSVVAEIDAQHSGHALAFEGDVSDERVIVELVDRAEAEFGPVNLYFANAGVTGGPGLDSTEEQWAAAFGVNVMAHVRAARVVVPRWLERGGGYFVSTASAAGLLTQLGSAPYAVSKHAAVGFAEWLSVTYGDRGIAVSCLCPMGVETALLRSGFHTGSADAELASRAVTSSGAVLAPDDVANDVLAAIAEERFLILPHPEVGEFFRHKAGDYERWLAGMRRYQAALVGDR
ncbi:SDR family NAD(P)-dependent oxidoreductase [Aldersonia sp. NBC_00410]|uniref:SDR family oxidoreductase n=1 Tax=Aldersonia sp. NBC_00410 TaxID=2975954 RepID=UPI00225A3461|nr:SDR family NAD(P)-dependent oxidoreductase [Aldersonia sp. NBC_00410]MCX5043622.1 SDR family NAD(P)-dependent oxidoreductase [Aldersonia sp. NBC_00410]